MRRGWWKRYLATVGVILAVIVGIGLWLKPSTDDMREQVEAGLEAYANARALAGEPTEQTVLRQTRDWLIARSYRATVGEAEFYCFGGFNITFCSIPD